jgi:hypothetical protein
MNFIEQPSVNAILGGVVAQEVIKVNFIVNSMNKSIIIIIIKIIYI